MGSLGCPCTLHGVTGVPMHFAWGHWGAYAICKVFHNVSYRFLDSIKGTVDDHFFGLQNLQKWWRWSTSITIAELSTSPGQKRVRSRSMKRRDFESKRGSFQEIGAK